MKSIRFIDLFAGCGGLSEGFIQAGYTPVAHVEMDKAACLTLKTRMAYHWLKRHRQLATYRSYLNGEITRAELYSHVPQAILDSVITAEIGPDTLSGLFATIDAQNENRPVDLIIGGPPCQAYSLVGRGSDKRHMKGDKRNYLFLYYVEFLRHYRPKHFVFENVIGLLSATDENGKRYLDFMLEGFQSIGYVVKYHTLNALDYSVPQARKRIILIGTRGDTAYYPKLNRRKYSFLAKDMFGGLPLLQAGQTAAPFTIEVSGKACQALQTTGVLDKTLPVTQHRARPNIARDLEIYRQVATAWERDQTRLLYDNLPERLRTRSNLTAFLDRYKVVAGDEPACHTVIAHIAKDGHYYIHPDVRQNRSLSIREAARFQTFPDNYFFESAGPGNGLAAPFRQIGNAVPVLLAKRIATAMKRMWK